MPQRIIAFEISDAELKATVLETTFRDYRIAGLHRERLAPDSGSIEEQVRRFVAQHALAGETILSALPGDCVTWRTLFLPFRDRKRLAQTIPFELENHVPFDLDEVVIDYQVLHRDRAGTTVLAALVPKKDLERHLSLLQAAGLDPKVVDLGPLSTLNSLTLVPDLPPTFAFLDFGPRNVTAALYRNGELAGLRTILQPLTPVPASNNGAGEGHADPLVAEIRWTLLALNGAPLDDSLPCYVAGDPAELDSLAPELDQALAVDVRRLDRLHLAQTRDSAAQAPAFTSSLGLALREVAPNATLGLNFRRGAYAYHRSQQELQRGLRGVAALAALVVALTVTHLYVEYRQQARHLDELEQQIRSVARATLPDIPIRNPVRQLQEEIELLQSELDVLNGIVPLSSSTSLDIFREISAAVPNQVRLDADDYMMDADSIRMRGNADSFESVDTIKQRILATGFFSDVQVRDARADPKGNGVDFRLIMMFAKDFVPRRQP